MAETELHAILRVPSRPRIDGRVCTYRELPAALGGPNFVSVTLRTPGAPRGLVVPRDYLAPLRRASALNGLRVRRQAFDPIWPPTGTWESQQGTVLPLAHDFDRVFISWDYGINPEQGRPAYLPASDLRVL